MPPPLSPRTFARALACVGVSITEHPGWQTTGHRDGGWGPVNGVLLDHSGPYVSLPQTLARYRAGEPGRPGPLAHVVIDKRGRAHLVGWGRAAHAGSGSACTLARVAHQDYPPLREIRPSGVLVDGDAHFYGLALVNTGTGEAWPEAQTEAACRVAYVLCRLHRWGERAVIGRREWSRDATGPQGLALGAVRARVAELLRTPPVPTEPEPDRCAVRREALEAAGAPRRRERP